MMKYREHIKLVLLFIGVGFIIMLGGNDPALANQITSKINHAKSELLIITQTSAGLGAICGLFLMSLGMTFVGKSMAMTGAAITAIIFAYPTLEKFFQTILS